jgi:hypothetical protein
MHLYILRLPKRENLWKRKVLGGVRELSCVWCEEVMETEDHMFASKIWYEVSKWIGVEIVLPAG